MANVYPNIGSETVAVDGVNSTGSLSVIEKLFYAAAKNGTLTAGTRTAHGTGTITTVAAGTVLYVCGYSFSGSHTGAASGAYTAVLTLNGVSVADLRGFASATNYHVSNVSATLPVPIKLTAGQTVAATVFNPHSTVTYWGYTFTTANDPFA